MATTRRAQRPQAAPKPRKLTASEQLELATVQDNAHLSTTMINGRRRVLECELTELDRSAAALANAVANVRNRRAEVTAMLRGIATVVAKR
jgi:hypothetical protein